MNEQKINERIHWLSNLLANQRNNIAALIIRMRGIGVRATTSLALHLKFTQLMEQVSFDREKELELLHEIETMEKRHLDLKKRKLLRHADIDKVVQSSHTLLPSMEEEKPKRINLLTLFGLLYLFSSKSIKHKNQGLTAN